MAATWRFLHFPLPGASAAVTAPFPRQGLCSRTAGRLLLTQTQYHPSERISLSPRTHRSLIIFYQNTVHFFFSFHIMLYSFQAHDIMI